MRSVRALTLLLVLAPTLSAQAILFECQIPGPVDVIGGAGDCEGLTGNSAVVTAAGACGLPTEGVQFASMLATDNLSNVGGSIITRPVAGTASELRVPIIPGVNTVSFDYAWNNAEGASAQWVDGFDVSVCDSLGNRLQLLITRDTTTLGTAGCNGPFSFSAGLSAAANAGDYLSFVSYNGGDTVNASTLHVDNILLDVSIQLIHSSPLGAGSLQIDIISGPPGSLYFAPVSLTAGNFPNGGFYGIDISILDILVQLNAGPPFLGVLDANGAATFGPISGAPSGLTLYSVALGNATSPLPVVSAPIAYTIP